MSVDNLKRIKRYVFDIYFYIYNYIIFKTNKVIFSKNFKINGTIYIRNKGKIEIGDNFSANSGRSYNPIGGDSILRLICEKEGYLSIGPNLGISNSTIVCYKKIVIGNYVRIGGDCKIWDADFHSLNPINRTSQNDNDINSDPIIIKDYAFIGGSSIILKGVTIGFKSIIAAGSIVTKNIPDSEIWGGNPAKFIRKI